MRATIAGMRFLASVMALVVMPIGVASAHIHLTSPTSRTDETAGNMQKAEHCGFTPGRTSRVSTFRPGQTITVTWAETIDHPGWFRIAFQPNGETFGIPPIGTTGCRYPNVQPCAGGAAGNFPSVTPVEGPDANNGSIVLKDIIADGSLSQSITFPNMECANCTLQLIQVMTDKYPYTDDAQSDDIYFNCADITLSNTAPVVDAGVPGGDGGGGGGGDASGGCSTGGGGLGLGVGLAFIGLVRRRRRA